MKIISFRISDVDAAMLSELQLRNRFPRDIGKLFSEIVRNKYDEWCKKERIK